MHMNTKNPIYTCSNNLIESKKLEIENILIDEKGKKNLVTCFLNCDNKYSIKILNLNYHEIMGKIGEHGWKKGVNG